MADPDQQRRFALEVVQKLRAADYEAYWAGGCVRDELLGRTPKDYDVATNATPPQIRSLFGKQRTLPLGAAFGVITVLGPRPAGTIEVATFRQDAQSSDGRHPDAVTFSSAEEDAARRDFTINGMFFDPIGERVIDYVGGQDDLKAQVVRAIGEPRLRFSEDKLRMLRAVRFAAGFSFALDAATAAALREMVGEIVVVSPERIAMELRRLLTEPGRVRGVRLMLELGLAEVILPEIVPRDAESQAQHQRTMDVVDRLQTPSFPLAFAALLADRAAANGVHEIGLRWKLSNKEIDAATWLVEHRNALTKTRKVAWSSVQPLLAHPWAADLVSLHEARCIEDRLESDYCREWLARPREELDPPPLITGDDLRTAGLPPSPIFKSILQAIRDAQLDGKIETKTAALELAASLAQK